MPKTIALISYEKHPNVGMTWSIVSRHETLALASKAAKRAGYRPETHMAIGLNRRGEHDGNGFMTLDELHRSAA